MPTVTWRQAGAASVSGHPAGLRSPCDHHAGNPRLYSAHLIKTHRFQELESSGVQSRGLWGAGRNTLGVGKAHACVAMTWLPGPHQEVSIHGTLSPVRVAGSEWHLCRRPDASCGTATSAVCSNPCSDVRGAAGRGSRREQAVYISLTRTN